MPIPKVPFLQYQILETIYENRFDSLYEIVGYPTNSLIIKSALKSLEEKGLLTSNFSLTDNAVVLVNKHYNERHYFSTYPIENLRLTDNSIRKDLFGTVPSFKGNGSDPIFRWYKYLEDFPNIFVKEYLEKYKISKDYYVLDPFSGSGTTLIRAKLDGYKSIGTDVNPAMIFIAKQKLKWTLLPEEIEKEYYKLVESFQNIPESTMIDYISSSNLSHMPTKELNQWLSPVKQKEIACMEFLINKIESVELRDLFLFILTRVAIDISYVSFCPGTTFYPFKQKPDFLYQFKEIVSNVVSDLRIEEVTKARNVDSYVLMENTKDENYLKEYEGKIDVIITSPPYPNDLEYTRQTRLEMYLLGFVKSMSDVQSIKKSMVKGSTKLIYMEDNPSSMVTENKRVKSITSELRERLKDKNWGFDYPKMIEMYYSDMYKSLENYYRLLVPSGACILVVGDQTTKGVINPVAKVLSDFGKKIGFSSSKIELHRKRRSTGHDIPIPEENLILIK